MHVPFARSNEGQRIVQLHLAGIPFATSQVQMTPLQTEFFVEAINYMNEQQAKDISGGKKTDNTTDVLKRKVAEARKRR